MMFRDNREGTLIASRTGGLGQKVFYIDDGKRRWILSLERMRARGACPAGDIQLLSDDEIMRLPLGGYVPDEWSAADRKSPPARAPLREIAASGLVGSGIEFGAGDNPFPIPLGCKVTYADRLSRDAFATHYHSGEQIDAVTPERLTGLCEMEGIDEDSLDFVVACHVLEHTTNPLLAMSSAYSRLTPGGKLLLVVPDKRFTFDKDRALTTLDHLILDYNSPSQARDRQHWEEWHTKAFPVHPDQLDTVISASLSRGADIHYHTWTYETFKEAVDYTVKTIAPFSGVWSHPPRREAENGIEFYFVLTK